MRVHSEWLSGLPVLLMVICMMFTSSLCSIALFGHIFFLALRQPFEELAELSLCGDLLDKEAQEENRCVSVPGYTVLGFDFRDDSFAVLSPSTHSSS
jgi:hypothetical protein